MKSRALNAPTDSRKRMRGSHHRMYDVGPLELPVIAAVDGAAAGAGFCLALAADFLVATPRHRFPASFNRLGLLPPRAGPLYTPPPRALPQATTLALPLRHGRAAATERTGNGRP